MISVLSIPFTEADLSDFMMKRTILLFWLELNLELNSLSEKLGIFISTDCKSSKRVACMFV